MLTWNFIERSQSVIDLFIGECNPADIFSAFYLKNLANTKIHLIANSGHNVVNDLKNKRVLVEIVNLGLTNQKIELAKNIYSSSKLYKFLNSYDYDPTYSNFVKFIDIYIKFYLDNKTDISSQNYIELIKFVCIATKHDSNFNTLLKSIVEKFLLDDQICTDSQQYLDLLVSLYGAAKIDSQLNIKILNIIKKAELEIACITPEILLYEPKANYRLGNYDAVINVKGLENYPEYQYWRANAAIKINNNKIAAEAAKAGYILIQTHPKKGESAYIGLANALHQLIQSWRISHYGTSTLLGT